ncbi:MAG: GNAT family N-acetyltransferase [Oceanicaulis sp.]
MDERVSDDRLEVRTGRLRLVAIDAELARLQIADRDAFFDAVGAQSEAVWPPVPEDAPRLAEKLDILQKNPDERGWRGWVFLMGWTPGGLDRAVGTGGFFGPPDETGAIEIGYAMAASFREQGLATEAVSGLLDWAFSHANVKRVTAWTEPHLTASRRVLEKTGFTETGESPGPDGRPRVGYERLRED